MKVVIEPGREVASGAFVSCVPEIEPPVGWGAPIGAALVYDGEKTHIPTRAGTPRADQMQGTELERLVELGGRICYDSLGTGRNSADYHKHIREVGHLSTLEHAPLTFEAPIDLREVREVTADFVTGIANRPGVHWWVKSESSEGGRKIRFTMNARTLYEMLTHDLGRVAQPTEFDEQSAWVARAIAQATQRAAQSSFGCLTETGGRYDSVVARHFCPFGEDPSVRLSSPETPDEKWISLYIEGSRIMSHEIVRHGDWTAISQRSGRYCDESESELVLHPAMEQFLRCGRPTGPEVEGPEWVRSVLKEAMHDSSGNYRFLVEVLERHLLASPAVQAMPEAFRKTSARKQARSAARGVLGHSLSTAMLFSASVRQWRHMLRMRAADAADAEIRALFAECILPILKASRYGADFADLSTQPASDGIGRCLAGGGAK